MLYTTTRNKNDVFTAYKSIHMDCAPDGGLFLPFSMPHWDLSDILLLKSRTFGESMADVLNRFFSCGLTGWDVEFSVGRAPVKVVSISQRTHIAEAWHNLSWDFEHVVQTLSDKIRKESVGDKPTNWMRIAVRIAAIFAVYGEMMRSGTIEDGANVDFAVTTGDFSVPMAAWYARRMGLPIGNIICGCNANGGVWDLLHLGEISTGNICVSTSTPDADYVVPRDLERLIHGALGDGQVNQFLECCKVGGTYAPEEEDMEKVRSGMFSAVTSDSRVENIIPSVHRTSGYVLGPYSALAYGSLQDYRAKTGETRPAILFSERSAARNLGFVAECMHITEDALEKILNLA